MPSPVSNTTMLPKPRRNTKKRYILNPKIDTRREQALHNDLLYRRDTAFGGILRNVVIIVLVITESLFNIFVNTLISHLLQAVGIICLCNIIYYRFVRKKVMTEMENQDARIRSTFPSPVKSNYSTPIATKMNFVKYTPQQDAASANPIYWTNFQSVFESFKRMTARNNIEFFPNDTRREDFDLNDNKSPVLNLLVSNGKVKSDGTYKERMMAHKERAITTTEQLKRYLLKHRLEEEDEYVERGRRNTSDSYLDISPLLATSEYQSSPSLSDSSICSSNETSYTNQEMFSFLHYEHKIEPSSFIYWISNFRMWLSKVVLGRIITEIGVVDEGLKSLVVSGLTIGNVSLNSLEDACRNPSVAHRLPSLQYLLPYLRVSTKQHYIVERFRTLSQGNGMGDFKWDAGGNVDGKIWGTGYPNDAQLVMHLFATYLDHQLPLGVVTSSTDSYKPFSSTYLADNVESCKQTKIVFIKRSSTPPHYDLLIDNKLQEIPAGRNNVFVAIVFFLYYIKRYELGMLGRISLDKHGINMLWIVDSN